MNKKSNRFSPEMRERAVLMLQATRDLTQREIAQQLSISTSGLNCCLKALIDKGLVNLHFSQSKNKFGYTYVLSQHITSEKLSSLGVFTSLRCMNTKNCNEIELLQAFVDAGEVGPFGI